MGDTFICSCDPLTESEVRNAVSAALSPLSDALAESLETLSGYSNLMVQIQSGMIFFMGLLFGLLLMMIFWGRFK